MSLSRPLRTLQTLIALLILYWIGGCAVQRKMIFPAGMANQRLDGSRAPGAGIAGLERLWIDTDEGRTEVWLVPAPGASAQKPAGLVVFAHGNAELIDDQQWILSGLGKLGLHVAMCEYRGYGRSTGSPSQKTITADHQAMLDVLLKRPEIDRTRLIYYGRSVGGGVVCSLARKTPPAAIILQSPFESVTRLARAYLIPSFLVRDPFDNRAALAAFEGPVLLMHGFRDRIIPLVHSQALDEAAPNSQLLLFDCGHNDFPVPSPGHWGAVRTFLEEAELLR